MNTEKTQQKQQSSSSHDVTTANDAMSGQITTKKTTPYIIAGLAVLSFAVGFLLVHFSLPRSSSTADNDRACAPGEATASPDTIDEQNDPASAVDDNNSMEDEQESQAGSGLPEVPPGPTPDGIRLDGAPLYFKCWKGETDASGKKDCDRLRVLEKRMATRLYVIDECKKANAGGDSTGLLSLGANLDFSDNSITFWSGPSSTIENASKIGNCVRQKLAGLPLYSVTHKHGKYRMFFSVDFFDPKKRQRQLAQRRKSGRSAKVTKDKVNVREQPIDGASLGRISSDSIVTFLKKNETGEWCLVLTPNNKEGWMICDALQL